MGWCLVAACLFFLFRHLFYSLLNLVQVANACVALHFIDQSPIALHWTSSSFTPFLVGLEQTLSYRDPHLMAFWLFLHFYICTFLRSSPLQKGFGIWEKKKKSQHLAEDHFIFSICIFLFSCSAREEDLRIPTKKKMLLLLFIFLFYFIIISPPWHFFLLCAFFTLLINELTWLSLLCTFLFF